MTPEPQRACPEQCPGHQFRMPNSDATQRNATQQLVVDERDERFTYLTRAGGTAKTAVKAVVSR